MLKEIARFPFLSAHRNLFKEGTLWKKWARDYPEIFDEDDIRIAKNQASRGYHFYEWMAAVLIYQSTGYLSLVEKYGFPSHKRKQRIIQKTLNPEMIALIANTPGNVQSPDLFVYAKDLSNWFLYEVKGPGDPLRAPQREYFEKIAEATKKPIYVIRFQQTEF